jgi:hypothetical protein
VPREWPAIPGHHGDVEDETVKRPRVLCHVGVSSLLTDGGSRLGRGQIKDGRIRPNPQDRGVRSLSYPPSRVIGGKIVCDIVCIVTGFHLPSRRLLL